MAATFCRLCTKLKMSLHLSPFKKLAVLLLVNKYTLHFIKAECSFLWSEQHQRISFLPRVCHMPHLYHNLFAEQQTVSRLAYEAPDLAVFFICLFFSFLGPNVCLSTLLLNTLSQCTGALLIVRDEVPQENKTTEAFIVLCSIMFRFSLAKANTKYSEPMVAGISWINLPFITFCAQVSFVSVLPNYVKFAKFSKNLLALFWILSYIFLTAAYYVLSFLGTCFCPVFCYRLRSSL